MGRRKPPAQPTDPSASGLPSSGSSPDESGQIRYPVLPSLARVMSVVMLVLGILAVGLLFYQVMAGFFVPLFLAALLVVLFRPLHQWYFARLGNRARTAALATTFSILGIVLLPLMLVLGVAATQFSSAISHLNPNNINLAMQRARQQFSLTLPHAEQFRALDDELAKVGDDDSTAAAIERIGRVRNLVLYLHHDATLVPTAEPAAISAIDKLDDLIIEFTAAAELEASEGSGGKYNTGSQLLFPDVSLPADLNDSVLADNPEAQVQHGTHPDVLGPMSAAPIFSEPQPSDAVPSEAEPQQDEPVDPFYAALELAEKRGNMVSETTKSVIHWRDLALGGAAWGQLRLLANPSPDEFADFVTRVREATQARAIQLSGATGGVLAHLIIGLCIMMISVYFFLLDGPAMTVTLMRLSPLDDNYERQLLIEFDRTSRAVVLASILSALAQGILAAIAFYVLGTGSVVLLFLATCMMALVPFLGAASVWIPTAIWLGAVEQRWGAALALAIYGALLISSIDNVIKVFVLHGRSQLHPLFALLSVLGGVAVFGPIGILVGPMVVVFLQTLLEILSHELKERDEHGNQLDGDSASAEPA